MVMPEWAIKLKTGPLCITGKEWLLRVSYVNIYWSTGAWGEAYFAKKIIDYEN